MARKAKDTPVTPDIDTATLNDKPVLTFKEATAYANVPAGTLRKAIAHKSNASIFDGAVSERVIHPEYPPLTEITKASLDAWIASRANKPAKGRAVRTSAGRLHQIRVPDASLEAVKAALAELPVTWIVKPAKAEKRDSESHTAQTAADDTSSESTADLFQAELVEA